jgi:hypothetical protein
MRNDVRLMTRPNLQQRERTGAVEAVGQVEAVAFARRLVVECARRVQQTEVAAHTRELDTRTCMYTYF